MQSPNTMPIYAFACSACGHHFDRLQKLSDADPTQCPACNEHAIQRQLTAPSFRLSGSGWYETDFKKDGDKKRNLSEKGETASGGDAKPETKIDVRSETKIDAKPAETAVAPKTEAKVDPKPAAKPASGAGTAST